MDEKYQAVIAIPPGETLAEMLEDREMSQKDLANRTGLTPKHINEIIQAKAPITVDTALKFEAVLGTPASFWTNLEANYQETLARLSVEAALESEIPLLGQIPYAELAKLGLVKVTRNNRERVLSAREFFSVASLERLPEIVPAAFRTATAHEASPLALAAWLRCGERAAQAMSVSSFQKDKLKASLPALRSLTLQPQQTIQSKLQEICSESGVAVVFVPHLPKTYVHGAAYWLSPQRAVVQMSFRRKYADVFWFSFFHEIGHILLGHSKKEVFISYDTPGTASLKEEGEADRFAADVLIPSSAYRAFVKKGDYSVFAIRAFADEINIHPGIVVGRLQHDRHLIYQQANQLREQYEF
ncbi:hypothetical protein SCACP_12370 [Sporomusa carbonis]|uniref:HigA family addiction module antitoxin n=1 Tax=Sporomusa carbonis TaxID=3076075 RepID=UPI003A676BFB